MFLVYKRSVGFNYTEDTKCLNDKAFQCGITLTHNVRTQLEIQKYSCDPGNGTKLEQFYYLTYQCIYIILPKKKQFDSKV